MYAYIDKNTGIEKPTRCRRINTARAKVSKTRRAGTIAPRPFSALTCYPLRRNFSRSSRLDPHSRDSSHWPTTSCYPSRGSNHRRPNRWPTTSCYPSRRCPSRPNRRRCCAKQHFHCDPSHCPNRRPSLALKKQQTTSQQTRGQQVVNESVSQISFPCLSATPKGCLLHTEVIHYFCFYNPINVSASQILGYSAEV
jgi:hypothetical protein